MRSRSCSAHSRCCPRTHRRTAEASWCAPPFAAPARATAFEAVTRAVTDGRYTVDRTLVRADLGRLREDFVFEVAASAAVDRAGAAGRLRHRGVHRPGPHRGPLRRAGDPARRLKARLAHRVLSSRYRARVRRFRRDLSHPMVCGAAVRGNPRSPTNRGGTCRCRRKTAAPRKQSRVSSKASRARSRRSPARSPDAMTSTARAQAQQDKAEAQRNAAQKEAEAESARAAAKTAEERQRPSSSKPLEQPKTRRPFGGRSRLSRHRPASAAFRASASSLRAVDGPACDWRRGMRCVRTSGISSAPWQARRAGRRGDDFAIPDQNRCRCGYPLSMSSESTVGGVNPREVGVYLTAAPSTIRSTVGSALAHSVCSTATARKAGPRSSERRRLARDTPPVELEGDRRERRGRAQD